MRRRSLCLVGGGLCEFGYIHSSLVSENIYIPEPAPVTIALLPLTLYGADLVVICLGSGCLAAMIDVAFVCSTER
jgi:hypothetical protein